MPDELDTVLDQAINCYSAVEPSADLAARILREAQQEPASRRGWKLALVFALPLAAALALVFVFAGRVNLPAPAALIASQPPTPKIAAPATSQPTKTLAVAARKPAVPILARHHAHPAPAPSAWARPLPAPYSKEELALLNFVQQHPKEAAEIAEAQNRGLANPPPQPITISHLEIKPLIIAPLN